MNRIIKRTISIILGFGFYVFLFWLLPNYAKIWSELLKELTVIEWIIAFHIVIIGLAGYLIALGKSIVDGWF